MSIKIYFIEGNRKTICQNNAFSVVEKNDATEQENLITILPASSLPEAPVGTLRSALSAAFTAAAKSVGTADKEKFVAAGLKTLQATLQP